MSGARGTPMKPVFSPGVLREIDKENVQGDNTLRSRTPDTRRKFRAVKLFHDETGAISGASPNTPTSLQLGDALSQAEAQVARYKEERRQAITALRQRNDRIIDLKATAASTNERYTALLKNHEEANKELAILRSQLANSSNGNSGNVERLKIAVESLETSNEHLREERGSLAARLAKREAAFTSMKDELAVANQREMDLREELATVQANLETATRVAGEREEAVAEAGGQDNKTEWKIQKAALEAQVKELEEQLAVAGRRCASVVAERAALVEESARKAREHETTIAELQQELESLQRRTSADLGDWQRRHREAVAARKAVEGQLGCLLAAGNAIAEVGEKQAALELSLREACNLLTQRLQDEPTRDSAAYDQEGNARVDDSSTISPERVVEGVVEHVLGRVFEATRVAEDERRDKLDEDEAKEREAEQELRREALATLGQTLGKLTKEMDTLRESGEAEANVYREHLYLEQERQHAAELEEERDRHQIAISEHQAESLASAKEVERLAEQIAQGEKERRELEMQLEATVQLSEMALAARVKSGRQNKPRETSQHPTDDAKRIDELEARSDELEAERRAIEHRFKTLQCENKELRSQLEGLVTGNSAPTAETVPRADPELTGKQASPPSLPPSDDTADSADRLRTMETRLLAVLGENALLERRIVELTSTRNRSPPGDKDKVASLQAEVESLRAVATAERARVERIKSNEIILRKYIVDYHRRGEQKMREMRQKLASSAERSATGS